MDPEKRLPLLTAAAISFYGLTAILSPLALGGLMAMTTLSSHGAESYPVKLRRLDRIGEKMAILITDKLKLDEEAQGEGVARSESLTTGWQLEGVVETLELNAKGDAMVSRLQLSKLLRVEGRNQEQLLSGGQTLIISDLEKRRLLTLPDGTLPEKLWPYEAIIALRILFGEVPGDPDVTSLLDSPTNQPVGGTWTVDSTRLLTNQLPSGFVVDKKFSGTCQLVAVTNLHGVPCLHVKTRLAGNLEPKGAVMMDYSSRNLRIGTVNFSFEVEWFAPTNEALAVMEQTRKIGIAITAGGKRGTLAEGAVMRSAREMTRRFKLSPLETAPSAAKSESPGSGR